MMIRGKAPGEGSRHGPMRKNVKEALAAKEDAVKTKKEPKKDKKPERDPKGDVQT